MTEEKKKTTDNHDFNEANKAALAGIRFVTVAKGTDGKSESVPDSPFDGLAGASNTVQPPFDMLTLSMLSEHSSELGQCVEAMATNIDATGHRFISRLNLDDLPKPTDAGADKNSSALAGEAKAEKVRLINFFAYATQESFTAFRKKLRSDLEHTGNSYMEVLRKGGEIVGFNHLPSYQMRLGKGTQAQLLVTRKILELQVDGSVEVKEREHWIRYRNYAQARAHAHGISGIGGSQARWFKEFGDTRRMDKLTGKYEGTGADQQKKVADKDLANEVIHDRLYSPRSPYGLPRFIGNLLSIFGDRKSEEINFITFKNNNIPSMVIAVSNGQLTGGTLDRLKSFVESQIQGSDNYSKFLIVEGETAGEDPGEDGGQVKIDITPLTNDQHNDALFQNYSSNNQDKIRRAFRLPPIFVGRSGTDVARATVEASRVLADEQVFTPARNEFDELFNRLIFPEMGIRYHKYKSNSPNTTDNQQIVKLLASAEKTGGMTPRIARAMLEQVLSLDLPPLPADFPADVPFSLTMAEAVKNMADPTEPGQQVTALKSAGILNPDGTLNMEMEVDDDGEEDVAKTALKFLQLNQAVEKLWKEQNAQSSK